VVLQSKKQKINSKEKSENSMPLVHLCSKENNKKKSRKQVLENSMRSVLFMQQRKTSFRTVVYCSLTLMQCIVHSRCNTAVKGIALEQ